MHIAAAVTNFALKTIGETACLAVGGRSPEATNSSEKPSTSNRRTNVSMSVVSRQSLKRSTRRGHGRAQVRAAVAVYHSG